jgi:protein-S-isoprenylcysteine O-methyltransferase Ste14
VRVGTTALTIGAFVLFALLPLWVARWETGRLPLPLAVRVALLAGMLAALRLRLAAMHALGSFFHRTLNVVEGQRIVRTGPFAWVRHPGYAANLLLYVCLAAIVGRNALGVVVTAAAMVAIWSLRVQREETMLHRLFATEYADYCTRVPARFVPFLL